jgi:hypothetical protein
MSRPTLTPSPSPVKGEGNFVRASGAELSWEAA